MRRENEHSKQPRAQRRGLTIRALPALLQRLHARTDLLAASNDPCLLQDILREPVVTMFPAAFVYSELITWRIEVFILNQP